MLILLVPGVGMGGSPEAVVAAISGGTWSLRGNPSTTWAPIDDAVPGVTWSVRDDPGTTWSEDT